MTDAGADAVDEAGRGLRVERPDAARVRARSAASRSATCATGSTGCARSRGRSSTEPAKASGQAPERGAAPEGSRLLPVRVVASASKTRTSGGGGGRGRRAARAGAPVRRPGPLPGRHRSQVPPGPRRGAVARDHDPAVGPHLHRLDADRHAEVHRRPDGHRPGGARARTPTPATSSSSCRGGATG